MSFRLLSCRAVLCVAAIGLGASALLEGCIDRCVMSGKGCNVSSDCEGGEVCLYPGPDDLGCPVLTGTCGPGECGNDLDCEAGCCNLETRQCGFVLDACAAPPQCTTNSDCGVDQGCFHGTCRSTCDDDIDCPGSERCLITCHTPIGIICSFESSDDCFGGDCVNTNAVGDEVPSYCTDRCNRDIIDNEDKYSCPAGYSCVDDHCLQQ